jgi:hypothetical protein
MQDTIKQSMLLANRNLEEKLSLLNKKSKKSELILDFKEFWHERLGEIKLLEAHENNVEWEFIFLCTIILPSIMFSLLDIYYEKPLGQLLGTTIFQSSLGWIIFLAAISIHTFKHFQYRINFPLLKKINAEQKNHNQSVKSGATRGKGENLKSNNPRPLLEEVIQGVIKIGKFAKKYW